MKSTNEIWAADVEIYNKNVKETSSVNTKQRAPNAPPSESDTHLYQSSSHCFLN